MRRLDVWQEVSGTGTGPLFQRLDKAGNPRGSLSARSVRTIVARRAAEAGIEGRVSGHSLRVGSAQSLVRAGASMAELKQAGAGNPIGIPRVIHETSGPGQAPSQGFATVLKKPSPETVITS